MATKKEIFDSAMAICKENGASKAVTEALTELLEPKKGGAQFELDEVAVLNANGEVTHILDSVAKLWVPVVDDEGEFNFYEKPDTELGFSRFSRISEKARKDAEKAFKASKEAIFADLMEGEISNEDAKALMDEAEAARKDLVFPDGFGTVDRPVA